MSGVSHETKNTYSASGALAWTYGGMGAKILCQFGIGIVIARLLGPEPYGIVATCNIVMTLCVLLSDGGISSSLIHHQDASPSEIAGALWLQFGFACFVTSIIVYFASAYAEWANASGAGVVLKVVALAFPIQAIGSVSQALLRRQLNMRIIQIALVISYLIGYGAVGLTLALNDFGVWTLVFSQLTQISLNTIILFVAVRPPIRNPAWPGRLLGFGGWAVVSNVTAWMHGNIMNIMLTRIFGAVALGQFNRLELVTKSTVPLLGGPIQQVLFPAISRSVNDRDHCQTVIHSIFRFIGLIFFPAMLVMYCFPNEVVTGIFGAKFSDSSEMLPPLALCTIGAIWSATVTSIFFGFGKPKAQWTVNIMMLAPTVIILLLFSHDTVVTLCWGFCLAIWARSLANLAMAIWVKVLTVHDVFIGFSPAILPAVFGGIGAWIGFHIKSNISPGFQLLFAGTLAIVGWGLCILLLWRWIIPEPAKINIRRLMQLFIPKKYEI